MTEGWQPNRRQDPSVIWHYYTPKASKSLCSRATLKAAPLERQHPPGQGCAVCAERLTKRK